MKPASLRKGDVVQVADLTPLLHFIKRDSRSRICVFVCPDLKTDDDNGIVTMKDSDVIRRCTRVKK